MTDSFLGMERLGKGTYSSSSRIRGLGDEGYHLSDIGARGSCRIQFEDHPAEQAQGDQSSYPLGDAKKYLTDVHFCRSKTLL